MSDYWTMWDGVKQLSLDEAQALHDSLPSRGSVVDFNGIRVLDHDLREALDNYCDGPNIRIRRNFR